MWPCDLDLWPFDLGQWSYMAGHVINLSTKFEDPKAIRSCIMSSDISHRIPLTVRLQPLCTRRITWPMCRGKFFPHIWWEIARMWLPITGGFRGRPIQRRHFWLQGSKGRCLDNQMLAKIGQKITKISITSVVCNISMQSLVLRYGLCHRGIHLWHSHTQGTKGRYHGNLFGD